MTEAEELRRSQQWLKRKKDELTEQRRQAQSELSRLRGEGRKMAVYRDALMGRDDPATVAGWRDQVREQEERLEDLDLYLKAADAESEAITERLLELKDEQPPKERRSPDRRKFDEVKQEITRRLTENDGRAAGREFNQLPDKLLRAANGCGAKEEAEQFLRDNGWRV